MMIQKELSYIQGFINQTPLDIFIDTGS